MGSTQGSFDFKPYLEGVGLLAGVANVIMQLAVPGVGYGVIESRVPSGQAMRHPIKRSRTTFTYLAVALAGSPDEQAAYREAVNGQHRQVRSDASSPTRYNAFDPSLQLWVAVCLYKGFADVDQWLNPHRSEAEREAFYQASSILGSMLQMREADWPADRAAMQKYFDETVHERVRIDPPVRDYLVGLMYLHNFGSTMSRLFGPFAAFIATGWLPQEFRDAMALPWTPRQQRRFVLLHKLIRFANGLIPAPLRRLPWMAHLWDLRIRRRLRMKLV